MVNSGLRAGVPADRSVGLNVSCLPPPLPSPLSLLCVTYCLCQERIEVRSLFKKESWQQRLGAELRLQSMFVLLCGLFFNVCETSGPSKIRRLGKEAEDE